jgi:hypothetical protein
MLPYIHIGDQYLLYYSTDEFTLFFIVIQYIDYWVTKYWRNVEKNQNSSEKKQNL